MDDGETIRRVLVVDDDLSFLTFICTALERLKVHAEVSHCGSDALRHLASGRWSGVLLDLNLPDVNGLDLLREIRQAGNLVPIVIVTGGGSVPTAVEAMRLGATHFLEKPVRLAQLSHTVETVFTQAPCSDDLATASGRIQAPSTATRHASDLVAHDLTVVVCGPADTPSVSLWADRLRVSSQVVHRRCERAGLRAKAGLDLGRLIRALICHRQFGTPLAELLDVKDGRSIEALLTRAAITSTDFDSLGIRELLEGQTLVRRPDFLDVLYRILSQNHDTKIQKFLRAS